MTNHREEALRAVCAGLDTQESQDATHLPPEDMQDVYVLIVREQGEVHETVVESAPMHPQQSSLLPAYAFCLSYLFLALSCVAFQCYCILNPPNATVTIIPVSQSVTLSGTVRLGRVLAPLTISQSQTGPATGKGHQDARAATGSVTLYNGQFQPVTISAGTILTGGDGTAIITGQDVTVPAANPPSFGQVSVSAPATSPGARGSIPAYDINQACCAASVLAKNTTGFSGGQDERTYTSVTQSDIHLVSTVLKTSLANSITGAGYSLFGTVHVSVQQAKISHTAPPLVSLSFTAQGTWMYGFSSAAQERIRNLISGKTLDQAERLLASLPGVKQTAIRFSGFGDESRLPKQSSLIRLTFLFI